MSANMDISPQPASRRQWEGGVDFRPSNPAGRYQYQTALTEWSDELDTKELASWSLDDFWHETRHAGHSVLDPAKRFVTEWVALVRKEGGLGRNREAANARVMTRERRLKKGQSRFANKSARDRWQGASGAGRLQFRWSIAQSHLKDLKR